MFVSAVLSIKSSIKNGTHQSVRTSKKDAFELFVPAAEIIKVDFQSRIYETSSYPPCNNFMNESEEMIPQSLNALLEPLLKSRRRKKRVVKKIEICARHYNHFHELSKTFYFTNFAWSCTINSQKIWFQKFIESFFKFKFLWSHNHVQILE